MEDEEAMTHTCKNCGGLIYYQALRRTRSGLPEKCGNIIPELQGAKILAFDRPEE